MMDETGNHAEHVLRNRAAWDEWAPTYAARGRDHWAEAPTWGCWGLPETELRLLPDLAGRDAVEMGCGTAYVSSWLARRGARVVGLDNSPAQLRTARALQREFGLEFPLVHGDAEHAPLRGGAFDFAISEYGASIWCDPYRWIPEAARLLRPGGRLVFLVNGTLHVLCSPDEDDIPPGDRLLRDYFGMHRFTWSGDNSVEFHLGYGDWIRLLRHSGFVVEDLVELRAPEGGTTRYPWLSAEWGRRWPTEEVWVARRTG
jgi:SAM-dependent methyltransferase